MDDDSGLAGLVVVVGLFLLAVYVIVLIVQAVILIVQAVAVMTAIFIGIALTITFFALLGMGANLLVRSLIGVLGDRIVGATPQSARIGLGVLYLVPPILMLLMIPGLVPATYFLGTWGGVIWGLWWFGLLFLSLPAYYWAWRGGELQLSKDLRFNPDRDLPFRVERVMRAEETILYTRVKLWWSLLPLFLHYKLPLEVKRWIDGARKSLELR